MVILRETAAPGALEAPSKPLAVETGAELEPIQPSAPTKNGGTLEVTTQPTVAPNYYGLRILPPFTAVIELAAIVAALLAIDAIWPALDINALQPNPYWLPVLLLTLQYGTASGTLAVVVAIVAYFSFATLPEQGVGENEFAYRLRILANPILWIATAVVLGQFRMIQIAAKRELTSRLGELEVQRNTLADYANRLRARCDALERDIASRPFYAGIAVLDALANLRQPNQAPNGAVSNLLAAAFPGGAISLFVRHGGSLRQAAASGWTDNSAWAATLPADHPLTKAMLENHPSLSVLRASDEAILDHQGLAAVPVLDPKSGKVQGMIKLEFGDSRLLTSECLAQMGVVAAAIAPLLIDVADAVQIRTDGITEPHGKLATLANGVTVLAKSKQGQSEQTRERPEAGRLT
jgi:polysaccharide biosynthesis protein PelD